VARWRERGDPPPARLVRFDPADWPGVDDAKRDAATRWGEAARAWLAAHPAAVEAGVRLNGAHGPVEVLAEVVRLRMCLLVGAPLDTPVRDVQSGRWRGLRAVGGGAR
jgi:hypothetical protein